MSRQALALALAFALAFALPAASAQESPAAAPAGAPSVKAGNWTLAHWVGNATAIDDDLAANDSASIWFAVTNGTGPVVVFLNVTASGVEIPNGTLVLRAVDDVAFDATNATALPAPTNATYAFAGEVYEDQNGTLVLVGPVSGQGSFTVQGTIEVPAPPAGVSPTWIVAGLALLGVLVIGGFAAKRSAERRRMNAAPRRSQVMREMELERKLEKVEEKDPEQAAVIKQEIRAQEQVRVKRRELQILEAKRADALKTIDLLRQRHEAGGLTKLQHDNMVAKKRQDLQRIEAEIAQMEAEDAAGGPAAA